MLGEPHFVDILEPRRTQSGIFRFMTRDWRPKRTQELERTYTPQDLKDITANSLYLEAVIEAESAKSGVSKEKLKKEVLSYIEEIGLDKKMHVIRWLGIFAIKLAFNMKIGIYVNEPAILKIKSLMGNNPVLFLPTHRSYADFCVMTYLCYHYDIEFPAVASGMDFYSMAVVGQVLRETCAFYMRRTLAGASLYAAALRQYVRTLVAKHNAPIEFFLEGTRSRSNKSLPPKFGMLSMALTALAAREVGEVTVVPVAISYDRLLEQTAFAYEHLGVPKPRESTRGLLKWVSSLNEEFGNMYINFGEPMSAKEYLGDIPLSEESLKPLGVQQLTSAAWGGVVRVGETAVGRQQAAAVTSTAHLLALALGASLHAGSPLEHDRLLREMRWLGKVLVSRGAVVFDEDLTAGVARVVRVQARAWRLDARGRLRVRAHRPDAQPPHEELRRRYMLLRKLLRYEFFYVEADEEQTFNKAFEFCLQWGVLRREGGEGGAVADVAGEGGDGGEQDSSEGGASRLHHLLSWAAWPALTTLNLCMEVMIESVSCAQDAALASLQRAAAAAVCAGAHPACLGRSAATHALRALQHAGALRAHASDKTTTYQLVPDTMRSYHELVCSILPPMTADYSCRNPVFIHDDVDSKL